MKISRRHEHFDDAKNFAKKFGSLRSFLSKNHRNQSYPRDLSADKKRYFRFFYFVGGVLEVVSPVLVIKEQFGD